MLAFSIRVVTQIFRRIPRRAGLFLGSFFGGLAFFLCFPRTLVAVRNLNQAIPEPGRVWTWITVFRMYQNFGKNLIDLFHFPGPGEWKKGRRPFQMSVEGIDHVRQVLKEGKGVLVLTAHYGNWELMAAWISTEEAIPVNILYKDIRQPVLNEWILDIRKRGGVHAIYKKQSIREMITKLKKNEIVGFVLDQRVNRREGEPVSFFGRPARTITGLATLSLRFGIPVVPIHIYREKGLRHRIIVEPPVQIESTGIMEEDIRRRTQKYTEILEHWIRRHPEQWIWIHKRWDEN